MYTLFLTIAEITLAMTPLLLIALLFSRFGRRFSAGCRYAIWCVLLLRLAIPLNFSLPVPAIDLAAPAAPAEPMPQYVAATPEIDLPESIHFDPNDLSTAYIADGIPDTAYVDATATLPTVNVSLDPTVVLSWVWAIGAAVVLAYQALTCRAASAKLRRWKLPVTDERLLTALARAKGAVGLRRKVSLWLCPEVSSPMLRGLIRPEILLPRGDYTDEQLDAILRHELIHCRRGDLWWKLCGMIAAGLHFFNPLVWIARRRMEAEMEQSCDDAVFRAGGVSRQTYGETMLAVARQGLATRAGGLNTHFHPSAKTLKQRFVNIVDSSAKRAGVWLIVLALIVAAVCGGLVSCREETAIHDDESAVIAAAMAAADARWGFSSAYVSFDGDTATVSAIYWSPANGTERTTVWADLTLTCADGVWTVTDGLDGSLNPRSMETESDRRAARELKRTAEVEAMISAVWPEENSLARYEAANYAYTTVSDLQIQLVYMQSQRDQLQAQLAALNQQDSMAAQKERLALEETLDANQHQIDALHEQLSAAQNNLTATLPAALSGATYPLAGGGSTIDLDVPAQSAEPGLELACSVGTPVLAVADGIVLAAGYHPVDGNFVLIDHGEGGFTRSCWLSAVSVAEGDTVKRGHQIGLTGRSGHARMSGLRFVFSLGAHADDPQMLFFSTDGILPLPDETTADPGFSIINPIAGDPSVAFPVPYVCQLEDGTVFLEGGVQYFAQEDTPVYATAPGTVTLANEDPLLGCYVQIDHGSGFETRYAHLNSLTVKVGQTIDDTTQIGIIGPAGDAQGPRISMSIYQNGHTVTDLMEYIFSAVKRDPHTGHPDPTDPAATVAPSADTTAPSWGVFTLKSPLLENTATAQTGYGFHTHIDGHQVFNRCISYAAEPGTPVFAAAGGTVTAATYDYSLGNYVTIEHWDGFSTTYAHLNKITYGLEPGVQIAQGTILGEVGSTGDSTGPHLGFFLHKDGEDIDPAPYFFNSGLRAVYTYTLASSLPKLHSWTHMPDLRLSSDTISRLGSEYTAIDYVIGQLYGADHKFGQYTLRPEQIIIDGRRMDSVWEIQYSSYESVLIAMQAGGGQMYFAEAVAPYRATAAVWHPIINGNTGSTLGKESFNASAAEQADPLFAVTVWFVKNEQYDVKLTGVGTAKLEVPVVYEFEVKAGMPHFTASMPLDGLLTRAVKERLAAEYQTALGYLQKKYGENHGFTTLILTTTVFENYESVWLAKKADGNGICIAMTAGGGSYLIGGAQSETTGLFAAPRFSDSEPSGDAKLTPSTADALFPCEITFTIA